VTGSRGVREVQMVITVGKNRGGGGGGGDTRTVVARDLLEKNRTGEEL